MTKEELTYHSIESCFLIKSELFSIFGLRRIFLPHYWATIGDIRTFHLKPESNKYLGE